MRRLLSLSAALAVASALLTGGASVGAAPVAASERGGTATPFALHGSGFGTHIRGGEIPAASGATAFQSLGCTNRTGVRRTNFEAEVRIPGLGKASGLRTTNATHRSKSGEVASVSRHSVARLVLAESSFGRLEVRAVSAFAKAFHGKKGFGTVTETTVGALIFTDTDGNVRELALPTPGNPVVVPGLLRISVGWSLKRSSTEGARAVAVGLNIEILPTGSRVRVSKAGARIERGIVSGIFSGHSNGTRASALAGNVRSGPTPYLIMPCRGTKGEVKGRDLAAVDLGGQVEVGALRTQQMAKQNARRATGYELAKVAEVSLGGGRLVIEAIQGKVTVTRPRGAARSRVSFAGTTVGQIVVDGEPRSMPPSGPLVIEGLAEIRTNVQSRDRNGGKVIAVLVKLLDGSGLVLNLGEARLSVRGAGR